MRFLGRFAAKYSKSVLLGFIGLIALSTIWGFQAFGALKGGGYDDPNSDSTKAFELLDEVYNQRLSEVIVLADFSLPARSAESAALGAQLQQELEAVEGVVAVTSFYTLGQPDSLVSDDGKAVYFFVDLDDAANQATIAEGLIQDFSGDFQGAEIHIGGFAAVTSTLNSTIQEEILIAEAIAVPIVMVLLLFVFGSLVAAGLPLLVGGLAILGSFFFIWVSSQLTDTSVFALNIATGLGLGLGIDYSLLMINRFREERAKNHSVRVAVERTVATAGRTVVFSGLTVAVVVFSLSFFPQYFLQSFASAGVAVVILAVLGAVLALPASLRLLGDNVNRVKLTPGNLTPKDRGAWGEIAKFVMRRPVPVMLVTLLGLGGLTSLASGVEFGQVDDRILPRSNSVAVTGDLIRERFTGRESSPVEIILEKTTPDDIVDYTIALSEIEGIVRVQSTAGIAQNGVLDQGYAPLFENYASQGYQRIVAVGDIEPRSSAGIDLTVEIRELLGDQHPTLVGGSAASYADSQFGIERALPWAAGWVLLATLLLLFLFTGSVILPIKAVLLNVLSLGATLGFVTWVFAEGHLQSVIGEFSVTGTIDTSSTVLIAVIAFGLSMDYELFLLSRIKEQHDAGSSTIDSVALGLQRSGRIITAAALVLAVTFIAFVSSGISIMKMLGLGIAFAIILDATVVRGLLVPALMRLFGDLNWWAPKWMKRIYRKLGLTH